MNDVKQKPKYKARNEDNSSSPSISPLPVGKKFRKRKPPFQDWMEAILFAFVVAMIVRSFIFTNFLIPSPSMESTLMTGDYLVANKMKYFFTDPQREDIVTFRMPHIEIGTPEHPDSKNRFIEIFHPIYIDKQKSFNWGETFSFLHLTYYARKNVVKRVIGVPGDTVEVVDKKVYVNGQLLERGYERYGMAYPSPPQSPMQINNMTYKPTELDPISLSDWYRPYKIGPRLIHNRDWFGPIVVPEGKYFVLGDNRDVSFDSRYWGFLDRKDITGTPWLIFWSKGIEFNKLYDKPHIRWERVFKLAK